MECEKSGRFEKYLDSIILWNFPQFYFHVQFADLQFKTSFYE